MEFPADSDTVAEALQPVLRRSFLQRIPKHPERRDVLLALVSAGLQRRKMYTEVEINTYLGERLAVMRAQVDHVTLRRYMVDCGFVKRDRAGNRYILNYPKLEETLSSEAREAASALIAAALESGERRHRATKPRL